MIGHLPSHVSKPNPEIYLSDNYVTLDFETTTLDKGSPLNPDNRIVLAVWRNADGEYKVRRAGEYELGELVADIEAADFVVAHNTKFELGWLRRCGLDLYSTIAYDTMLAEYVLGGNTIPLSRLSLSACLERAGFAPKFDLIGKLIKGGVPTEEIPTEWLERYCVRDVEACHELFELTRVKLKDKDLLPVTYQRNLVTPCLTDIEFNGMQLDTEVVTELADRREAEFIKAERSLVEFCGGAQPGSPKQMAPFIYETLNFAIPKDHYRRPMLTASGTPSVAAAAIAKLVPKTIRQRRFVELYKEYAELKSDVTKYLRKLRTCCDDDGGRLYGQFNQTTTQTHRLSSTGRKYGIQFQNLNRNFKPLFRSREDGWSVGEMDGAQLEFRVAVDLGRDATGLASIRGGEDVHAYTASVLTSAGEPTDRQGAKAHTFKPLYGGNSGTDAQRAYYAAFREKYPGIAATQQSWCSEVLRTKELVTPSGLRYYWPDTYMAESGYITNTTAICNYPVQALATADIIPLGLVAAWHRIRSSGMRSFIVNTVHDSIIAEVAPDETEAWHELAEQSLIEDVYTLIDVLYDYRIAVPLGAGVMLGSHWGDKASKQSETVYTAPEALYIDAAKESDMIASD